MENKIYRVFVTRHFIAVKWYDVVATSPKKAGRLGEKAAKEYSKGADVRSEATDNHWHSDEPMEIGCLGYGGENGEYTEELKEVINVPGAWESKGV